MAGSTLLIAAVAVYVIYAPLHDTKITTSSHYITFIDKNLTALTLKQAPGWVKDPKAAYLGRPSHCDGGEV